MVIIDGDPPPHDDAGEWVGSDRGLLSSRLQATAPPILGPFSPASANAQGPVLELPPILLHLLVPTSYIEPFILPTAGPAF